MKLSFYNYYVDYNKYHIYYNSYTNNFLLVKPKFNSLFSEFRDDLEKLKQQDVDFYTDLVKGGFIVDNELDEQSIIHYEKKRTRFLSKNYQVMINPTLDCNLGCWYCYENHIAKSTMSKGIMDSIMKNIESKYSEEPFSTLSVGFFGGEPLIKTNNVVVPFIKKVESFAKEKSIKLKFGITTNGTMINDKLLSALKTHIVFFQITFDGYEELHNKTRCYKNGSQKSFPKVIENLHKIKESLENYTITLRINYDNAVLDNIEGLIDSLAFLDPKRATFHLNRVWQISKDDINKENLIYATNYIMEKGYIANLCTLNRGGSPCYADNYNQILVNYDGLVFKCSSRDFTDQNSDGVLLEDGTINWNMNKLSKRLGITILARCKDCKLLPTCPNICSQTILDGGEDVNKIPCYLDNNPLSFEDYIAYNFKRSIMAEKLDLIS